MVREVFSFRTFFYLGYAVILTAVLLYIRFPTEKFKQFCENRVELILPDSTCTIDRVAYLFPFSLIVANFQLAQEVDGKRSGFHVARFMVTPYFTGLFRKFAISGEMYKGSFVLKLDIDSAGKIFRLNDVLIKEINIDEWATDFNLLDRKLSGIVGFSGNYQAKSDNPLDGTGEGELVAIEGNTELLQPVLSLSTFEFERIAVKMAYEKQILRFIGGEVSGKEISADFTGEIRTTLPLFNSDILLSGHLTPKEGFLAAHPEEQRAVEQLLRRYKMPVLPFKLGGTVKRPTFRFSM
jgi:type II secretion system protein N